MTAVLSEAPATSPDAPQPRPRALPKPSLLQRLSPLFHFRWLQTALLLALAAVLFCDRALLCEKYLFRYTDEDQAIMWHAAKDLLDGNLFEPCFYGQDYNSCIEGYLAAPLIHFGTPYHIAVPFTTVMLGLLPYLLTAFVAWWRKHSIVAGIALLIPILLPTRYAIMTGIPRGFVTGLAFAIIPALLLLPPARRPHRATTFGEEPKLSKNGRPWWLRRTFPATRYFLAAVIAVISIQLNPSCLLLLVPVAVYMLMTTWREPKFWLFGAAGLLAAAPYPLYCYQFYYTYHDDYRTYMRGAVFTWSEANFNRFLPLALNGSTIAADFVPIRITDAQAPYVIAGVFAAILLLLSLRGRIAGAISFIAAATFLFVTFAFSRVNDGRGGNAVTYPYARMFLPVPVTLLWFGLLAVTNPPVRFSNTPPTRWLARGALVGMLIAAMTAYQLKRDALPGEIKEVLATARVVAPISVAAVYATAREVQKAADASGAKLVVTAQKDLCYLLPQVTTCKTLFASSQERRTWRIIEESTNKPANFLTIGIGGGQRVAGGINVKVDPYGNLVESSPPTPPQPANARGGLGGGGGRGPRLPVIPSADETLSLRIPDIYLIRNPTGRTSLDMIRTLGRAMPAVTTRKAPQPQGATEPPATQSVVQRGSWY